MPLLDTPAGLTAGLKLLTDHGPSAAVVTAVIGILVKVSDRAFQFREKKLEDAAAIRGYYEKEVNRLQALIDAHEKHDDDEDDSWHAKYIDAWSRYEKTFAENSDLRMKLALAEERLKQIEEIRGGKKAE